MPSGPLFREPVSGPGNRTDRYGMRYPRHYVDYLESSGSIFRKWGMIEDPSDGVPGTILIYSFFAWNVVLAWLLLTKGTERRPEGVPTDEQESEPSEDGTSTPS